MLPYGRITVISLRFNLSPNCLELWSELAIPLLHVRCRNSGYPPALVLIGLFWVAIPFQV